MDVRRITGCSRHILTTPHHLFKKNVKFNTRADARQNSSTSCASIINTPLLIRGDFPFRLPSALLRFAREIDYREDKQFHGLAKDYKGEAPAGSFDGYLPLLAQIMKFFETGIAPVKPEETIEIFAFITAADESKRLGGAPVKISDVLRDNGWAKRK